MSSQSEYRFSDHERVAHPTECNKYYVCRESDSEPLLLSCPRYYVFDNEPKPTKERPWDKGGVCRRAKDGPEECRDFYGDYDEEDADAL